MRNRARILAAATSLLSAGGREAVSTRAVSTAAGVQAPTIYRLFGDKQGLLDALAVEGLRTYLSDGVGNMEPGDDPVDDVRRGWDQHVGFGLAHPALYSLIYGEPRPDTAPPAAVDAGEVLADLVHRVAQAGRLRLEEKRATALIYAAGCGTTLTLLASPVGHRDLALSEIAREAVISATTTEAPVAAPGPIGAAVTLRAALPAVAALSAAEKDLLAEWLDRIVDG